MGSIPVRVTNKKALLSSDKRAFLRDAFLADREAHCVRDADFVRDVRLRRVSGTHRITYHSAAASLIADLQNDLTCGIMFKKRGVHDV